MTQKLLLLTSMLAGCLLLSSACDPNDDVGPSTSQMLTVQEVEFAEPCDTTPRIPKKLLRGDREFDGGPFITTVIWFTIGADGRSLTRHIYFRAEETKGDYTTVEDSWVDERIELKLPKNMCIQGFAGPHYSVFAFRGKDAGAQIFGPLGDVKEILRSTLQALGIVPDKTIDEIVDGMSDGNPDTETPKPVMGGPVEGMELVGDTGGPDVSDDDDPKDDTHIKSIKFGKILLYLRPC